MRCVLGGSENIAPLHRRVIACDKGALSIHRYEIIDSKMLE